MMDEKEINLDKTILQQAVERVIRNRRLLINEHRDEVAWNVGKYITYEGKRQAVIHHTNFKQKVPTNSHQHRTKYLHIPNPCTDRFPILLALFQPYRQHQRYQNKNAPWKVDTHSTFQDAFKNIILLR